MLFVFVHWLNRSNYEVSHFSSLFFLFDRAHIEDCKEIHRRMRRREGYKQLEDIFLNMSEEKFSVTRRETSKLLLSCVDVHPCTVYTFMNFNKYIIMFTNIYFVHWFQTNWISFFFFCYYFVKIYEVIYSVMIWRISFSQCLYQIIIRQIRKIKNKCIIFLYNSYCITTIVRKSE